MTCLGVRLAAASICILALGACGSENSDRGPSDGGGGGMPGNSNLSTAPAPRGGAPAAWMPTAGEMLIFGGIAGGGQLGPRVQARVDPDKRKGKSGFGSQYIQPMFRLRSPVASSKSIHTYRNL